MTYAKLIDGNVVIFHQPAWILGDASQYAITEGYKELIGIEGTGGTYETETQIIVESMPPSDWLYPERPMRITVPVTMLFSSPTWLGLWNYTQAMDIPSLLIGNNRVIYLETLEPAHEAFILSQNIIIEEIPTE